MMNIPQPGTNLTPEQFQQFKNNVTLLTAEIAMQERELVCWNRRGEAERNLYLWIADALVDPGRSRTPLDAYREWHKAHYNAQAELKQLAIARLRSELAITEAIVREAEKQIREPGYKGLITQ